MDSPNGHAPTSTEEWLSLLQKQEMVHQMELEKWHEMLGAATELLRKVTLACFLRFLIFKLLIIH